jgi:hypothetical protein
VVAMRNGCACSGQSFTVPLARSLVSPPISNLQIYKLDPTMPLSAYPVSARRNPTTLLLQHQHQYRPLSPSFPVLIP